MSFTIELNKEYTFHDLTKLLLHDDNDKYVIIVYNYYDEHQSTKEPPELPMFGC